MRTVEETTMSAVEQETLDPIIEKILTIFYGPQPHTEIELIEAFRKYVAEYGSNVEPLSTIIIAIALGERKGSLDCLYLNLLDVNNSYKKLLQQEIDYPNVTIGVTLTNHAYEYEDCYRLEYAVIGFEKRTWSVDTCVYIPASVIVKLLQNTALDGSNIELGKQFDANILMQLYQDHSKEFLDAENLNPADITLIEFCSSIATRIVAGLSNEEILELFKAEAQAAKEAAVAEEGGFEISMHGLGTDATELVEAMEVAAAAPRPRL